MAVKVMSSLFMAVSPVGDCNGRKISDMICRLCHYALKNNSTHSFLLNEYVSFWGRVPVSRFYEPAGYWAFTAGYFYNSGFPLALTWQNN
jgi:hypothetical protein